MLCPSYARTMEETPISKREAAMAPGFGHLDLQYLKVVLDSGRLCWYHLENGMTTPGAGGREAGFLQEAYYLQPGRSRPGGAQGEGDRPVA